MITHLRITQFALIDELELALGPGLTVLTGETGAGKSLVVDAVALLRGGRASAEIVRGGADEARVEAQLEIARRSPAAERLDQAGLLEATDGETTTIVVRRIVTAGGRGRVYVNGQLATANLLGEVMGSLVELAGQHEHQRLADPGTHLELLDAYGVPEALTVGVRDADARLADLAAALQAASGDEQARADREEYLRFQITEIDSLAPKEGEDGTLRAERDRLRSIEKLRVACARGEEVLYAREGSVTDEIAGVIKELASLGAIDPDLGEVAKTLEDARATCEDGAERLRRHAARLSADPERLVQVEERLDALGTLLRKHGPAVTDLLRRRDEMRAELDALGSSEARRGAIEAEIARVREQAAAVAEALSRARRTAAAELGEGVEAELGELGMVGARLAVEVAPRLVREGEDWVRTFEGRRLGSTGWDRVELSFSANRGESPRPLARTASGGELSRLMLALKQALSRTDSVRTYVFDEVDAGVGGAIAEVIGRKLRRVSRGVATEGGTPTRQVLCVTHLPQIAAFADAHVFIAKETVSGRTVSLVRPLSATERLEEIARMLGGLTVTETTRAHAAEMLARASEPESGRPAAGRLATIPLSLDRKRRQRKG